MSSTRLKANGNWLAWARRMSGFKTSDIAKRMGVNSNKIIKWEKTGDITSSEIKKLAKHYHRPPMLFYNVNNPSNDYKNIADFRTIGSEEKEELSPSIIKELQNAENKRENLIVLEDESEDYTIPEFNTLLKIENNTIETIAEHIRKKIGMTNTQVFNLKSSEKALDFWIHKIEELGVLVFQFYDIEPKDLRGYAIYNKKLPIIGINKKEFPNGKKFTLFHELAHIFIQDEKISISNINTFNIHDEKEILCNKIAAEILVPTRSLEIYLKDINPEDIWKENNIKYLSKQFHVSKEVILRRLLTLNKISNNIYNSKKDYWEKEYLAPQLKQSQPKHSKNRKEKNKIPVVDENNKYNAKKATEILRKNGNLYTQLVLDAYDSRIITNNTMTDYLGTKLQVINEIRKKIAKENHIL
ncbi:MAG: ImmA/IrrE family metallo-endopeptidase [Methanobrevibacter sp.]|jgi:Zn-dependent peptidase ImmA (M78 family)|nr:ImmA/IrrE family metallo-endopeptidase [Candidatus Methanoflexus mossambicus]